MRFRLIAPLLLLEAVATFAHSSPAGTQIEQTSVEPAEEPLSAASHKCWTSGSGASYFQICVSKHGNVVRLKSPANVENIRLGDIGDGYVACASNVPNGAAATYYDAGSTEAGWAEPYKVTAAPVIHRKTQDGKLELVQSFKSDAGERDLTITMTLYNRSNTTLHNVRLDRYADFDVDNNVAGDIFHKSPRAVFAWDQASATNFVSMTELTAADYTTAVHSWSGWQKSTCNQASSPSPTSPGDGVGRISYNFGTMAAGASKTVKILYRVQ